MNLIKINLLPYRQILENKKKQQFNLLLGVGAILGLVLSGLIYVALDGMVSNQQSRNDSLKQGIDVLKKDLTEIAALQEKRQALLDRKQKVEELDLRRFEAARIVDDTNRLLPDGVVLTSIKGNGNQYVLEGIALNNDLVANFMQALPTTGVFNFVNLEVQSITATDEGQQFVLNTSLIPPKRETLPVAPVKTQTADAQASTHQLTE